MAMDLDTGGKKKKGARPEMNVTPLVDVVLVLLIIFMVLTPMMAQQFWLNLPDKDESDAPPPTSEGPIVLSVGSDGTVRINQDEVARNDIPVRLRRVLAARGTRTIFFDAHDDAPYGDAVEVLDLARGAGASGIAVATEPLSGID